MEALRIFTEIELEALRRLAWIQGALAGAGIATALFYLLPIYMNWAAWDILR